MIVPGATPTCTALGPVYRNAVAAPILVAMVGSTADAMSCGSGGVGMTLAIGPLTDQLPAASPACN